MKRWRDDDKKIVNVYQNILNSRGSILRYPLPPPPDKDFHDFVKIFWMSLRPFKNDELRACDVYFLWIFPSWTLLLFSAAIMPLNYFIWCWGWDVTAHHYMIKITSYNWTRKWFVFIHISSFSGDRSKTFPFQVRGYVMKNYIYIHALGCFTYMYKSATFFLRIKAVFLHTY